MKQKAPTKTRNPFVQHLLKKKQGSHTKSKKAERQKDKVKLKKGCFDRAA